MVGNVNVNRDYENCGHIFDLKKVYTRSAIYGVISYRERVRTRRLLKLKSETRGIHIIASASRSKKNRCFGCERSIPLEHISNCAKELKVLNEEVV